jgi:hypothetical protein
MWHLRVRDPDLWLEGTFGDRFEADQKHIVDMHEAFAYLPPTFDGPIHSIVLRYDCERL